MSEVDEEIDERLTRKVLGEDDPGAAPRSAHGDDRALVEQLRIVQAIAGAFDSFEVRSPGSTPPPAPTWGPFLLKEEVGRGTFGVVCRAFDPAVEREVAVKLYLRDEVPAEPRLLGRVQHPNVVTVHGAATYEGRRGIWMEFVEGRTLAERVEAEGPLPPSEALRIGIELCKALGAVHEAGLVHQDVKPRNVMETPGGRVVLMDFGAGHGRNAPPPGRITGTPLYMAPEVVLGRLSTPPSDVYSLGVLIYYLLTGTYPTFAPDFAELSRLHERHGHGTGTRRYLATIRELRPEVSTSLAQAVAVALAPLSSRYPTAASFQGALERAQRGGRELQRSALAVVAAGAVLVAVFFGVRGWSASRAQTSPSPLKVVPLTTLPGLESQPALSPDGAFVAFTRRKEWQGQSDIYVGQVGLGEPIRITSGPAWKSWPAWSPDGRQIAFLRGPAHHEFEGVYMMPALGGQERRIGPASRYGIGWSPDGQSLAVSLADARNQGAGIVVIPLDGGAPRRLTTPPQERDDLLPAFSPDGREVAFLRSDGQAISEMFIAPAGGGDVKRVTPDNTFLSSFAWRPGSHEVVYSASASGTFRLWRMDLRAGRPELIPDTGDEAHEPTFARTERFAFTRMRGGSSNIRGLSLSDRMRSRLLADSTHDDNNPHYSPDGTKLAFVSDRSGVYEIWVADADGSRPLPVTTFGGAQLGTPRWSPDGARIAFDVRVGGNADIYVVGANGGRPSRLTEHPTEDCVPSWSRDGRWIYFASARNGTSQVWKVSPDGGTPEPATTSGGFAAQESPDGRFLYFTKGRHRTSLWRRRIGKPAGPEETIIDAPLLYGWGAWTPARAGVYYIAERSPAGEGAYEIRLLNLGTRQTTTVHKLDRVPVTALTISPDGASLAWDEVESLSDLMLVESFR